MPRSASDRSRPAGRDPLTPASRAAFIVAGGLLVLLTAYLLTRGGADPAPGSAAPRAPVTSSTAMLPDPSTGSGTVSPLSWVTESALPQQARDTLALIRAGGPYPYPRNDDQVFGNRERRLPAKPHGYYREYTVVTPGSDDRGARRIIVGRDGDMYYTDDHYGSFRRIQEGR